MIHAKFEGVGDRCRKVTVSGHAGYADAGEDIVCASVTSAVQLTANAVTEILRVPADVKVLENSIAITLPRPTDVHASRFLQALRLHLELLAQDYEGTIQVTVSEV